MTWSRRGYHQIWCHNSSGPISCRQVWLHGSSGCTQFVPKSIKHGLWCFLLLLCSALRWKDTSTVASFLVRAAKKYFFSMALTNANKIKSSATWISTMSLVKWPSWRCTLMGMWNDHLFGNLYGCRWVVDTRLLSIFVSHVQNDPGPALVFAIQVE